MSDRLLVTGATGFVGQWVLRYWRTTHPDVEVWATSNEAPEQPLHIDRFLQLDLTERDCVERFIAECRPNRVIHLAGLIGRGELARFLHVNVVGTENLYEALLKHVDVAKLRVVQASSAAAYGLVREEELPITEQQAPRPIAAYGLSKLAQDYLATSMFLSSALHVICGRIFNTIGPGQPLSLVPMTFAKQLLEVRDGKNDRLKTGDTSTRRDFVDVRDIVRALEALLRKGTPGEVYNIASGQAVSIQEVIDKLIAISGLKVAVEPASNRLRPTDVPCVRADVSKIMKQVQWSPEISIDDSLQAMWEQLVRP
jgi:GDP-4-dehydro-6-deoxy-D-mannose reductase